MSSPSSELSAVRSQIQELIRCYRPHPVLTTQIQSVAHEGPLHLQSCRVLRLSTGAESQQARVEYADGSRYTAMLIPRLQDGRIQLLLRYRPAIARWSLELPRNTAPDDEVGWRMSAEHELAHSTGLGCPHMQILGSVNIDPCFLSAVVLVVLAENCHSAQSTAWDEMRQIAGTVSVLEETLPKLIVSGDIECGLTLSALSIYFAQQRRPPPQQ